MDVQEYVAFLQYLFSVVSSPVKAFIASRPKVPNRPPPIVTNPVVSAGDAALELPTLPGLASPPAGSSTPTPMTPAAGSGMAPPSHVSTPHSIKGLPPHTCAPPARDSAPRHHPTPTPPASPDKGRPR